MDASSRKMKLTRRKLLSISAAASLMGINVTSGMAVASLVPLTYNILCTRGIACTISFNSIFAVLFGATTTRILSYNFPPLGNVNILSANPNNYIMEYRAYMDRTYSRDDFEITVQNSLAFS